MNVRSVERLFQNDLNSEKVSLSVFRFTFSTAVEALGQVNQFRRWALNRPSFSRVLGVRLMGSISPYQNHEGLRESSLEIFKSLSNLRLTRNQDLTVLKISKKVSGSLKASEIFKDLIYEDQILLNTVAPVKIDLEILIGGEIKDKDSQMIEHDGREFYLLNRFTNPVVRCNFEMDLYRDWTYLVTLETRDKLNHMALVKDFLRESSELYRELSQNLHEDAVLNLGELEDLGFSTRSLAYIKSQEIESLEDLTNSKSLDLNKLSSDSLQVYSCLKERKNEKIQVKSKDETKVEDLA